MADQDKKELENVCRNFRRDMETILSWKWDSRFEMVLAEFPNDRQEDVRTVLARYLDCGWDHSDIRRAPAVVHKICDEYLGGLRAGQFFFATNPEKPLFMLGAWWPWDDGKTVSLRLAPFGKDLSETELNELTGEFNTWFGVRP